MSAKSNLPTKKDQLRQKLKTFFWCGKTRSLAADRHFGFLSRFDFEKTAGGRSNLKTCIFSFCETAATRPAPRRGAWPSNSAAKAARWAQAARCARLTSSSRFLLDLHLRWRPGWARTSAVKINAERETLSHAPMRHWLLRSPSLVHKQTTRAATSMDPCNYS